MSSRVYGATEAKILTQLERNLAEEAKSKGSWRIRATLIVAAGVVLSELIGEPGGIEVAQTAAVWDRGECDQS